MKPEIRFIPPYVRKEDLEVPDFRIRFGELREVVSSLVMRSLRADWEAFIDRGPREYRQVDIGGRLNDVAVAVGEMQTEDAVRAACIQFRHELPLKMAPEMKEIVWDIFVFGNNAEQWAAALAIEARRVASDDEHPARDKYLRKIHDGIEEGPERDIPDQIWTLLESITMSKHLSNAPNSGDEKKTPEKPPLPVKPK